MTALWCGCVLGLLCIPACLGTENTVTVTQTPTSTSKINVNSSAVIMCSITGFNRPKEVLGLSLDRRFGTQENVMYVSLKHHPSSEIYKVTPGDNYRGRVNTTLEVSGETSLRILFTLSRLQVEDTDMFFCRWKYLGSELQTFISNGNIFIVERFPDRRPCSDDFFMSDTVLFSLCVISIPVLIFSVVLLVYSRCKRSHKKFTPSPRASVTQNRRQHICPTPRNENYSYLNVSGNSDFSLAV